MRAARPAGLIIPKRKGAGKRWYNTNMHVILTHEQADFDALAAELGAYLLNEHALPVIPRRLNRNVRAFLTLYGAELPFIEARDLPPGPISAVTLVDTQSTVTLKGMTRATTVHVIDHHQLRPDLPANWTISTDRVGATTTLFVERLQARSESISSIHATLLLLGIYEDTGSLTYESTTARDVRAAAFLLEESASLNIVSDYLNPPLSPDQRLLYDRLLSAAQTQTVHGLNIIVMRADATDMNEEISTIAHKMRDLLDPDALFLLVTTTEGIRLVARSTTDQINVAAVAAHFGGGGHTRAAAALIKAASSTGQPTPPLNQIYDDLLHILPEYVQPSITVRRMMSRHPRLLTPNTPVKEAAFLMQRYGYEGYPVVQDGKVIGLLTRRAVDRALAHKLNLPASELMEAGQVSVQPQDTLEHLQRVMTSSGWGQVPVVDPQSGAVIGIVTRTDLLKTLSGSRAVLPGKLNLTDRLEAALPPGRIAFLKLIAAQARDLRLAIYIVGGFVRDLLLERPSTDFDLVVEGDAIALAHALTSHFGGRMTSHSRFGTAKWQIGSLRSKLIQSESFPPGAKPEDLPESLDLISARTEFYDYPTALPTVERSSIKLDLHRRDFTINTMALRLDGRHYGELYDYWGGLTDLQLHQVRVLHSLSFVDDPTRLLRAVRFEQRFAFHIESRTLELMSSARPLTRQVSGDRLRHELNLIFLEDNFTAMLERLKSLELLTAIHPELTWDNSLAEPMHEALTANPEPAWELPERFANMSLREALGYLLWLGRLPADTIRSIADRMRFSRQLKSALESTTHLWKELHELRGASPSRIVSLLDTAPPVALYALLKMHPSAEVQQMVESYLRVLRHIKPYTSGTDLRQMQITPGPGYRLVLEKLRAAWLDGTITSRDEELNLRDELLRAVIEGDPAE